MFSRNRVAQLYLRALGSFHVVSYDSQGYGGVILILHLSLQVGGVSDEIVKYGFGF
jgi:hypothetical protein